MWDVCGCAQVCPGVPGCAQVCTGCVQVYLGVRGCTGVCAVMHGCSVGVCTVQVCERVRGCAWVCVIVRRFAPGYACMCGMNFQNFFRRIESLHQWTLIRIEIVGHNEISSIFSLQ